MADSNDPETDLSFLDAARTSRDRDDLRRRRIVTGFSVVITLVWFFAVLFTDNFGRVWDNIVAAPTMLFGSFVAGATPQGGGAVAFPVFTKGLGVPSEVARTFSLCIQSVGMLAASFAILVRRRPISQPAVLWSLPFGLAGFALGLWLFTDRTTPFWASVLPGAYVKVFFTLLVVSMAVVVFLGSRVPVREIRTSLDPLGRRQIGFLCLGAVAGGLASSQVGSGADVFMYLVVVVMLGLEPRIAVPSSVLVMAAISLAGFFYLGLFQGHLDVDVANGLVTSVGGTELSPAADYPARQYDLLGLWLAAVPVVCWGAPLGSAFAARITNRQLAGFVAVLAGLEALTTVIFLEELRTDPFLVAFALVGGAVLIGVLIACVRFRHRIAQVHLDTARTITRDRVDVGPEYLRGRPSQDDHETDAEVGEDR